MLPKVETAAQVVAMDLLLAQVERAAGLPVSRIGIEAQIETTLRRSTSGDPPRRPGWRRSSSAADRGLDGDARAHQRRPDPDYPGDHFHYVFSKILMAGRAFGLQVMEGPYLYIRAAGHRDYASGPDPGLRRQVGLHPDQVTILNEVFSPTQEQFDRAWDILEAYRTATEDEGKAVMFGDEMIGEIAEDGDQVRVPWRAGRADAPRRLSADAQGARRRPLRHGRCRRRLTDGARTLPPTAAMRQSSATSRPASRAWPQASGVRTSTTGWPTTGVRALRRRRRA
jgi:hypothetical protein